jgi:hypothetical protein
MDVAGAAIDGASTAVEVASTVNNVGQNCMQSMSHYNTGIVIDVAIQNRN